MKGKAVRGSRNACLPHVSFSQFQATYYFAKAVIQVELKHSMRNDNLKTYDIKRSNSNVSYL